MTNALDKEKREQAILKAQRVIEDAGIKNGYASRNLFKPELLEDGKCQTFSAKDNVPLLKNYISELLTTQNQELFDELIPFLELAVVFEDASIRENIVLGMTQAIATNLKSENIAFIYSLLKTTSKWLIYENTLLEEYPLILKNILISVRFFLEQGLWLDAELVVAVLFKIDSGEIEKTEEIKEHVSKTLTKLSSKNVLEQLTNDCLSGGSKTQELCQFFLSGFGDRAVIYLFNRLMHSEKKQERIALITLIPKAGVAVVPTLVDCMEKNPPWFVIRNLIFIISEIGDTSLFALVRPYLSYKDIRVQHQALKCIKKFGGEKLRARFIDALFEVDDKLKVYLVRYLSNSPGAGVEDALIQLLEKRYQFSKKMFADLLASLCISLRSFPSENCFEAISELVSELKKTSTVENNRLLDIAEESLFILKPKLRHLRKGGNGAQGLVSLDVNDIDERNEITQEVEEKALTLAGEKKLGEACALLLDQIETLVEDREFAAAEYLQDRLLDINPMAFEDVIRIGEIIEKKKEFSMVAERMAIWSDLYNSIGARKFKALYFAMKQQNYAPGEIIVKAGEIDPTLYFINSGTVNLYCQNNNNEIFLKKLVVGDIFGFKTFFSASVWTHTLIANSDVNISVLHSEKLVSLNDIFPDLDLKLGEYSKKRTSVPELVKMSGSDRRKEPRYSVSVAINSIILDLYGNPGKRAFKGELTNISRGGLCFIISLSNRKNARMLLGRRIVSQINSGKEQYITVQGTIVSVQQVSKEQLDFTVNVKFLSQLDNDQMTRVVNLAI